MKFLRFLEHYNKTIKLESLTKYNIKNNLSQIKLIKLILHFDFTKKFINKKLMILFFLILELLTNQKSFGLFAKKPIIKMKIHKGDLIGCKVILRRKNLYFFLNYLILALPRLENFKGLFVNSKQNINNTLSFRIKELFSFYTIEAIYNLNIKNLQVFCFFNKKNLNEKIFLLNSFLIPIFLKNK